LRRYKRSSADVRRQVDALNAYLSFLAVSSALTAVAFMAGKSGTPAPHTNPGVGIAITN